MDSASEFLNSTTGIPSFIGDAPPTPPPVAGAPPPADPMKPWRSIEVGPYVPIVQWGIRKAYDWVADRTKEPLWKVDQEELESLPLTEAVQKCLYDLRLSRWTDNPYFALLVALTSLSGIKYAAIKIARQLEEMRELERRAEARHGRQSAGQNSPASPENDSGEETENQSPPQPPRRQTVPFRSRQPRPSPQNQRATNQGLLTVNGKTPGSGGEFSFADSLTQGNPTYLLNESDQLDE